VIVSEGLVKKFWPDGQAIGHTFRFLDQTFQVVGIAREVHLPAIDARLDVPEFYHPYTAAASTPMGSLRCEPGSPEAAVIRYRLASSHAAVRIQDVRLADQAYARQLARPR